MPPGAYLTVAGGGSFARKAITAPDRERRRPALPEENFGPCTLAAVNDQLYVLGSRQRRVQILSPAGHPRGELQCIPTALPLIRSTGNSSWATLDSSLCKAFSEEG
jgi:hypothetical protein